MDATEQNKKIVTEFIDALFTAGDPGAVDEYLAAEFVNHDPPAGVSADREGMRAAGAMFRAAFPDWHSEMDILVGEGDLVVEHFTASGTHQGEIFGVPPSEHLAVVSMTDEAERWLAEIGGADWPSAGELPVPVYSAAAGAAPARG